MIEKLEGTVTFCFNGSLYTLPSDDVMVDEFKEILESASRQTRIDEFAKAYLTGVMADSSYDTSLERTAGYAYDMAEAMENEREKRINEKV